MEYPPFTIFAGTVDPPGILRAIERTDARVELRAGTMDDWREVVATWRAGERSVEMVARHDPERYAGPGWVEQIRGMFGYFLRAGRRPPPLEVLALVRSFRFAVMLRFAEPLGGGGDPSRDPFWRVVEDMCRSVGGVIFFPGVLLDARGQMIFSLKGEHDPAAELPSPGPPHPMLLPQGALYDRKAAGVRHFRPQVRLASCDELERLGFAAPFALPQVESPSLRPVQELARRLLALHGLFAWVARQDVPDDALRSYLSELHLRDELTEAERETIDRPREEAHQRFASSVGWRLENMWPLAWALGFEQRPAVAGGMIGEDTIQALTAFLPRIEASSQEWLAGTGARALADVVQLEDLFHCAHHSVRAAQMGSVTVPADFHPLVDGGVVHERRHALTWALSPGTSWDHTDLST